MYEERTKTPIDQVVIVIAVDGESLSDIYRKERHLDIIYTKKDKIIRRVL